jgi:bifunctional NMN adenylyltransferase/nudix hydrolase
MKEKTKNYSVGVIIGRFQINELHEAHKELIDTVLSNHPKVFIFLGLSQVRGSINDPLDYQPRKQMILEAYPHDKYPNLTIGYIKDNRSDDVWSEKLDAQIRDLLSPNDSVVLYGSRDSFLTHYRGHFDTKELQATRIVSGTELRAKIALAPQSNPLFRAGAIWASAQRYPLVYSTVDVLVFDPKGRRVLLARKPQEEGYRIVGGYSDPKKDDSFEQAAVRELSEETGISVGLAGLRYVGSKKIDDWRYRNNPAEKIITHLYIGLYVHGCPQASDDISEVRWFDYNTFNPEMNLVEEHRPLWTMAKTFIDTNFPVTE